MKNEKHKAFGSELDGKKIVSCHVVQTNKGDTIERIKEIELWLDDGTILHLEPWFDMDNDVYVTVMLPDETIYGENNGRPT